MNEHSPFPEFGTGALPTPCPDRQVRVAIPVHIPGRAHAEPELGGGHVRLDDDVRSGRDTRRSSVIDVGRAFVGLPKVGTGEAHHQVAVPVAVQIAGRCHGLTHGGPDLRGDQGHRGRAHDGVDQHGIGRVGVIDPEHQTCLLFRPLFQPHACRQLLASRIGHEEVLVFEHRTGLVIAEHDDIGGGLEGLQVRAKVQGHLQPAFTGGALHDPEVLSKATRFGQVFHLQGAKVPDQPMWRGAFEDRSGRSGPMP